MLSLLGLLLFASLHVSQAPPTGGEPSARRPIGPVAPGAPDDPEEAAVDPLEAVRALYRDASLPIRGTAGAGDALVFAPDGRPQGGAVVVLVRDEDGGQAPEILEHTETGPDGGADLTMLDLADRVVFWAGGTPATVLEGELLMEHRRLAKRGPLRLRLDPSDVVTGRITLDGEGIEEEVASSLGATFHFPSMTFEWPAVRDHLERALHELDPPGRSARVRVDDTGSFRVDGLRWPNWRPGRPLDGALSWRPKDVFLAELPEGEAPTRAHLRRAMLDKGAVGVPVRLARGGWVAGRVAAGALGSLDRDLELRFGLPGSGEKGEHVPVASDGSFRFAVPLPFSDLDLELPLTLSGIESVQSFSFEAPGDEVGREWDLGTLRFAFHGLRLLLVRDEEGRPIEGANALLLDEPARSALPPAPVRPELRDSFLSPPVSGSRGRLLTRVPEAGEELWVDHPLFERTRVEDVSSEDGSVVVVLHRASLLRLTARFPPEAEGALPPGRLLVQVEAERPAWVLHRGDRTSLREAALDAASPLIAARLIDGHSKHPWSFTTSFGAARWDEDGGAGRRFRLDPLPVLPGVPFHLRVFDPVGRVFFEGDVAGLLPGESRELTVDVTGPFFSVEGEVRFDDGSDAGGLELSFGRIAPVMVGRTEADGRFHLEGLSSLEGALLVERSGYWIACGGWNQAGPSSRGRIPDALAYVSDFRFRASGPTLVQLPAPNVLEVVPMDPAGRSSQAKWKMDLYSDPGGVYLGGFDPEWSFEDLPPTGERRLTRPNGADAVLVLVHGAAVLRRAVSRDETHIEVAVPSLGSVEVDTRRLAPDSLADFFELDPVDGGERATVWREGGSVDRIEDVAPGRYLLRAFARSRARPEPWRIAGPREVTVLAGAVTRVEL